MRDGAPVAGVTGCLTFVSVAALGVRGTMMSDFARSVLGRTVIAASIFLCLALSAILLWEGFAAAKLGHDYSVYWRTANQPAELAYRLNRQPFPYAPTMLPWIYPLGFVSRMTGYLLVSLAGVVALVLACRPYLTRAAMFLVLISPPFTRCIRNGQVSAILAALMIWACGASNRILAGAAFGVTASIKPQLVIMAPLMLALNRDWRAFLSAGASFLIIVLLSVILFGAERWPEWVASMDYFHRAVSGTNVIDIGASPAAVAESFGLNPLPFLALGIASGATLVWFCRDMDPLEKATAIGAGSLLAAPYALAYDLVVVVPFFAKLVPKGRLSAFLGITGMLNPLPLAATAFELVRLKRDPVEGRHVILDGVAAAGGKH